MLTLDLTRHGETEENVAKILQGHLPGRLTARGLEQAAALRDELCAIVPLGSALAQKTSVTLRELSEYPFLMREPGSAVRQILDASFSLLQITVHPVWQSASTQAIVSAVAEGLGVAVLPRMLVERDAKEEIVRMLPIDKPLVRELNIVYHRRKFLTRNMQDFIALCREPLEKMEEPWDAIRRRREEHEAV